MGTHIISVLLENSSGALSRVAGLFSSRGYNISSLSVAETEDPTVSRMTIVVDGEASILEQIVKQLNRLIDVIKVIDFTNEEIIERELVLIRIDASRADRTEIIQLVSLFNATIVAVTHNSITVEIAGTKKAADDLIALLKPYGIKELVRSGKIAIAQRK